MPTSFISESPQQGDPFQGLPRQGLSLGIQIATSACINGVGGNHARLKLSHLRAKLNPQFISRIIRARQNPVTWQRPTCMISSKPRRPDLMSNPRAAPHLTSHPSAAASSIKVRRNNRSPRNSVGLLVCEQELPDPRMASSIIQRPPELLKPS